MNENENQANYLLCMLITVSIIIITALIIIIRIVMTIFDLLFYMCVPLLFVILFYYFFVQAVKNEYGKSKKKYKRIKYTKNAEKMSIYFYKGV